jgi:hypothetical protein
MRRIVEHLFHLIGEDMKAAQTPREVTEGAGGRLTLTRWPPLS